jgi:adenosylhomocysteine nucleosidase
MTTAILSALAEEQHGLLDLLTGAQRVQHAGREFWTGQLHGQPVVLALSRIGKVAAATTATCLIERFGAQRIVFTGVAGGLGQGVQVGDVVVASHFLQHDMDASPLFPRHEVPLYGLSRFAGDARLNAILLIAANDQLAWTLGHFDVKTRLEFGLEAAKVHQGLVISGDRFVATSAESAALQAALPAALAVEMEGAAVAQVCHDYAIPFAAVRTISDRADDAAHVDFPRFVGTVASVYARAIVGSFLRQLSKA